MEKEIRKGQIWSHYKNPNHHYKIICIARHSETLEEMVVYKILYKSETGMGEYWVRPKNIFLENLVKDGKEIERFSLVKDN
jgi:hypothetical protein